MRLNIARRFTTGALLLLLFVALQPGSRASADDPLRLQITGIDTSDYPNVRFVVSVRDRDGLSVQGIGTDNLSVNAGSRQLPLSSVQGRVEGAVGISALLAIDSSGSMAGAAITSAKDAAVQFVNALRDVDEVSVLAFADNVVAVSDFSHDFNAVRSAIGTVNAVGNTALYSTVSQAATSIAGRTSQRKLVLLLSDGADFGGVSKVTRQQSLDAARTAGVPYYVIGLGPSIDRQYLQQIADVSSGRLFIAPSARELQSTYSEIANLVKMDYLVTLDLRSAGLQGDTSSRLTINVGGRRGEADFLLPLPLLIPDPIVTAAPEGSSALSSVAIAAVALLGIAGGAFYLVGKRRRQRPLKLRPVAPPVLQTLEGEAPQSTAPDEVMARLVVSDGSEVPLGRSLVTLGAGPAETYRLKLPAAEFGEGTIRIWLANGRYLLHDLSARPRLRLNGNLTQWAFLSDQDELEIGTVRMRFQLSGGGV